MRKPLILTDSIASSQLSELKDTQQNLSTIPPNY